MCRAVVVALTGALVLFSLTPAAEAVTPSRAHDVTSGTFALSVTGNQLVDGAGVPIVLHGVDLEGTEYDCTHGNGIFTAPTTQASVQEMAAWNVNAVRIPLNEDCWLGINGAPAAFSGAAYRDAIVAYVHLLAAAGIYTILDLHFSAPGSQLSVHMQDMADADHAPAFWGSVASSFLWDGGVLFDAYNEPQAITWACWRDGCSHDTMCTVDVYTACPPSTPWQTAGMQSLVDAIRATGATQPIALSGIDGEQDFPQWLSYEPYDPLHQLVASVHVYQEAFPGASTPTVADWEANIAPVAAQVPVITAELGESDCASSFVDDYAGWADQHGISYLAWAWEATGGAPCVLTDPYPLLSSWDGAPSGYGRGFQSHLLGTSDRPPSTVPASQPAQVPPPAVPASQPAQGYWEVAADGGIFDYGDAGFFGSRGGQPLNARIVGMAATPDGKGYWLVASDGGIFNYGDAGFFGSAGALPLNKPIVGMAATPDGKGYWMVASDGGIFNYGDAGFYGSAGSIHLNEPIVGMAATPDGKGYWMVASDGGIFNYGDAGFYGSTGSLRMNAPVVGVAPSTDGYGYWLAAADGGVFNYGDAGFYGSAGSLRLNALVTGILSAPGGRGYWLVARDGGIFNYGAAAFLGSAGGAHLNSPVVGF